MLLLISYHFLSEEVCRPYLILLTLFSFCKANINTCQTKSGQWINSMTTRATLCKTCLLNCNYAYYLKVQFSCQELVFVSGTHAIKGIPHVIYKICLIQAMINWQIAILKKCVFYILVHRKALQKKVPDFWKFTLILCLLLLLIFSKSLALLPSG